MKLLAAKGIKLLLLIRSTPDAKSIYINHLLIPKEHLTLGSAIISYFFTMMLMLKMARLNIVASYILACRTNVCRLALWLLIGNCDHIIEKIVELSGKFRPGVEWDLL